jgi:hypothetical protein
MVKRDTGIVEDGEVDDQAAQLEGVDEEKYTGTRRRFVRSRCTATDNSA